MENSTFTDKSWTHDVPTLRETLVNFYLKSHVMSSHLLKLSPIWPTITKTRVSQSFKKGAWIYLLLLIHYSSLVFSTDQFKYSIPCERKQHFFHIHMVSFSGNLSMLTLVYDRHMILQKCKCKCERRKMFVFYLTAELYPSNYARRMMVRLGYELVRHINLMWNSVLLYCIYVSCPPDCGFMEGSEQITVLYWSFLSFSLSLYIQYLITMTNFIQSQTKFVSFAFIWLSFWSLHKIDIRKPCPLSDPVGRTCILGRFLAFFNAAQKESEIAWVVGWWLVA